MARIEICGVTVLVDDEDVRLLNGRRWGVQYAPNDRIYVRSSRPQPQVYLHRLLISAPAGLDVDHVNGNTLDNRKLNLRAATRGQNMANGRRDNPSGFRGITPFRGKWMAQITANGQRHYLGTYDTPQAAARAFDQAALDLHGAFARLNFSSATIR